MRIGIYHPYSVCVGGAQRYLGVLAEVLARTHAVEIVHHCPDFDAARVAEALDVDLSRVNLRYVPRLGRPDVTEVMLWQRYRLERDWGREISAGYELFINSSEGVPLFCHARRGVLITHFPLVRFEEFHGETGEAWREQWWGRRLAARLGHRLEWRRRFATYARCITNSQYSEAWLRRLWGLESVVVYPPLRNGLAPSEKQPIILSVAAFHAAQHKKHEVTLKAFRNLCDAGLSGWRYVMVGACGTREEDQVYVNSLRERARSYPVEIRTNIRGGELKELLQSSSVLWHSMGYGVDGEREPGLMEHFGMVVTEAMAAGCVPVVFDGGGLRESVVHGQTGFLWSTLGQLGASTSVLVSDEPLRTSMARAAVLRAGQFSRERFRDRMLSALAELLE